MEVFLRVKAFVIRPESYKTEKWREITGRMAHSIENVTGGSQADIIGSWRTKLLQMLLIQQVLEKMSNQRVAMADCADLLTLWGRGRERLYMVRERCSLSLFLCPISPSVI